MDGWVGEVGKLSSKQISMPWPERRACGHHLHPTQPPFWVASPPKTLGSGSRIRTKEGIKEGKTNKKKEENKKKKKKQGTICLPRAKQAHEDERKENSRKGKKKKKKKEWFSSPGLRLDWVGASEGPYLRYLLY
ncbi:uncharacterized protein K452DRAFT_153577 [Aplosporella prunicola CBS 121167]|uniref:Uncharacterized protein n=1 Tax=Aplosporella prunicola CBS 121167 TaxID=1176127 RepID=A0A6A6BJ19_9PEZI|nr:uncharacterized protein K452DRAFT_153577 [Aplosporella prunicola CBS 121167]KAF2144140.1 hypothetical protein K452DRAFT_153577 [Aplosporella prunicola CBS 121167]